MSTPPIALTIGDPNGIGPEIAVKAAVQAARDGGPSIVLVGDEFVVRSCAELYAGDFALHAFDGSTPRAGVLHFMRGEFVAAGSVPDRGRRLPRADARPSIMSPRRSGW